MKEQLILLETAKLAKEKSYEPIIFFTNGKGDEILGIHTAPTQTLLQKWLREEYMIRVFPYQGASGNFKFDIFTYPIPNNIGKWERSTNIQSYNTYEEALEKGLQEALKLITNE